MKIVLYQVIHTLLNDFDRSILMCAIINICKKVIYSNYSNNQGSWENNAVLHKSGRRADFLLGKAIQNTQKKKGQPIGRI